MAEDGNRGETERLARRGNQVRTLHRVSTELNAAQDVPHILDVAMDTMDELFGFSHCSVFLFEPAEGVLKRAAVRGESSRGVGEQVPLGRGMIGAAAAKRELVRLNRSSTPLTPEVGGQVAGHLAAPMLAMGDLVGVIYLETQGDRPLRLEDATMVAIVANQSGVALRNASLYRELEARVEARTSELAKANHDLRETQAELVQSGKMAALGQLAAGLAHEMNTPLGVIRSNADVVARAVSLLAGSAELNAALIDAPGRLGRTLLALTQASQVMQTAGTRLFTVFKTLRSFARLDESALEWSDLHEGLESALALCRHRLEPRIEVVRQFDHLPLVHCCLRELNQVFSIALLNAIEAIDGAGTITLRTRASGPVITIEIVDTGRGIGPEQLEKVFDPGFDRQGGRVKAGLSLAIAFRVLERHQGRIQLMSELGEGTTVRLTLPVERNQAQP